MSPAYRTSHCDTCTCHEDGPSTRNLPHQSDACIQTDDAIIITVETVPTVKEVCNTLEKVLENADNFNSGSADLPALNVGPVSPIGTATYSSGRPSPGHSYAPLVNTAPITWDTALVQPVAAVAPFSVDGRSLGEGRHLRTEHSTTWDPSSDDHMTAVSILV